MGKEKGDEGGRKRAEIINDSWLPHVRYPIPPNLALHPNKRLG